MLTRRQMLRRLLAAPIAATLDVEKLLWIPGQMVTVPAPPVGLAFHPKAFEFVMAPLAVGDRLTIMGRHRIDPVTRLALPDLQEFVVTGVATSKVDVLIGHASIQR